MDKSTERKNLLKRWFSFPSLSRFAKKISGKSSGKKSTKKQLLLELRECRSTLGELRREEETMRSSGVELRSALDSASGTIVQLCNSAVHTKEEMQALRAACGKLELTVVVLSETVEDAIADGLVKESLHIVTRGIAEEQRRELMGRLAYSEKTLRGLRVWSLKATQNATSECLQVRLRQHRQLSQQGEIHVFRELKVKDCSARIFLGEVVLTQYYSGGTLLDAVFGQEYGLGQFDVAQSMAIFRRVLLGIQHLHRLRVAHRDLKLANIMLADQSGDPDYQWVIDPADATFPEVQSMSAIGTACGTPGYAAPEQIGAYAPNFFGSYAADVFAAGVIGFSL
ncbi:hypothetical protein HDU93_004570 [Gonapodya sp. JEL0774]|nr:hypothetical protein HDU93_004570 [Gonapodya sp. JEL0774]